jgi:hypothetical protein
LLKVVKDALDVERVGMSARLGKDFGERAGAYSSVPIFRTSKRIDGALQLVADNSRSRDWLSNGEKAWIEIKQK